MNKRIVIFASGNGTNAEKLIRYFRNSPVAEVVQVFSNRQDAKVLDRARALNVPVYTFNKEELNDPEGILLQLQMIAPDVIVLSGFLWKFPALILKEFSQRVINIHPALLPKYGGKGMYGKHVHDAVVANRENNTGITVHFVNEHYDEGAIIFQKSIPLSENDTSDTVAAKVHRLEYEYFPGIIEKFLKESANTSTDG